MDALRYVYVVCCVRRFFYAIDTVAAVAVAVAVAAAVVVVIWMFRWCVAVASAMLYKSIEYNHSIICVCVCANVSLKKFELGWLDDRLYMHCVRNTRASSPLFNTSNSLTRSLSFSLFPSILFPILLFLSTNICIQYLFIHIYAHTHFLFL